MKKRVYMFAMALALFGCLAGCGKKEEETTELDVRADVVEFVNEELPPIKSSVDSAVGIYNAYFENENRPEIATFKGQLENEAIPALSTAISDLNAVEVASTEAEELKSLYVQGVQKEYEAMKMVVSAIDGENADYLTQADTLISDADTMLKNYQTRLNEIAAEQGITVIQ